jgi:hypothetical protein
MRIFCGTNTSLYPQNFVISEHLLRVEDVVDAFVDTCVHRGMGGGELACELGVLLLDHRSLRLQSLLSFQLSLEALGGKTLR